jgi:hypothetical protein
MMPTPRVSTPERNGFPYMASGGTVSAAGAGAATAFAPVAAAGSENTRNIESTATIMGGTLLT